MPEPRDRIARGMVIPGIRAAMRHGGAGFRQSARALERDVVEADPPRWHTRQGDAFPLTFSDHVAPPPEVVADFTVTQRPATWCCSTTGHAPASLEES